ncbi:MAG: hypothetical protein ACWA5R_13080 [bacterium]
MKPKQLKIYALIVIVLTGGAYYLWKTFFEQTEQKLTFTGIPDEVRKYPFKFVSQYLRNNHYHTELTEHLESIPEQIDTPSTIILRQAMIELTELDQKRISAWLAQGHQIISGVGGALVDKNRTAWLDSHGIYLNQRLYLVDACKNGVISAQCQHQLENLNEDQKPRDYLYDQGFRTTNNLTIHPQHLIEYDELPADSELLTENTNALIAARFQIDQGELLLLSDIDMLSFTNLIDGDNALFLLSQIPQQNKVWVQWGVNEAGLLERLWLHFAPSILLLLGAFSLLLWRSSIRSGRQIQAKLHQQANIIEHARTSGVYLLSKQQQSALLHPMKVSVLQQARKVFPHWNSLNSGEQIKQLSDISHYDEALIQKNLFAEPASNKIQDKVILLQKLSQEIQNYAKRYR